MLRVAPNSRGLRVQYQSDYILRVIEQMGAVLREASARLRGGEGSDETFALIEGAIEFVVDMDAKLFLRLSPQAMLSFIELSDLDDRVVGKLAETLELEADVLDSEGSIVEARVRREQSKVLISTIGPMHAN